MRAFTFFLFLFLTDERAGIKLNGMHATYKHHNVGALMGGQVVWVGDEWVLLINEHDNLILMGLCQGE